MKQNVYPIVKKDRFDYYDKLESNFKLKSQIRVKARFHG